MDGSIGEELGKMFKTLFWIAIGACVTTVLLSCLVLILVVTR